MDLVRTWIVCAIDPHRADLEYDGFQSQFLWEKLENGVEAVEHIIIKW